MRRGVSVEAMAEFLSFKEAGGYRLPGEVAGWSVCWISFACGRGYAGATSGDVIDHLSTHVGLGESGLFHARSGYWGCSDVRLEMGIHGDCTVGMAGTGLRRRDAYELRDVVVAAMEFPLGAFRGGSSRRADLCSGYDVGDGDGAGL